ncbi:MAG: NAD(P)-binding domain-containing protein, partial [Treponema sp.]|nr:NAD(P)-binding domain-containing protein [Treponema sp.]
MNTIGFIGMGNMAQAMACGFIDSGKVKAQEVSAYAPNQAKLKENASKIGFSPASTNLELVQNSKIVFLACKPYQIEDVLKEVKSALEGKVLVSVAAGWTFDTFAEFIDVQKVHVQCVMPNTPAKIG